MTDNPLIVDESLFSPKMIHQSTRDCVLSCNLMSKLGKRFGIMSVESSFYGENLCFFNKKINKKKCLPTYSNFEFEKMGTKIFCYHGLNSGVWQPGKSGNFVLVIPGLEKSRKMTITAKV